MVYAIIKAESNFDPNVKSSADARGLMQLMEETAIERSNVIDNEDVQTYDLYDPETNIKLGTSYFAYLLGLYDDNMVLAIIAYNAGLGNVEQWIKDGVIKADGSDIENIPYKETENYVRKILRDYQMYLKLYEWNFGTLVPVTEVLNGTYSDRLKSKCYTNITTLWHLCNIIAKHNYLSYN